MQALLDLIESKEDASLALGICAEKNAAITHKTHDRQLDEVILNEGGFTTNFGGYGSYSRLGLGHAFGERWKITDFDAPRNKPFSGLVVYFAGSVWDRPVAEQAALVLRSGGEVADAPDRADIIVLGADHPPGLTLRAAALHVTAAVFQRALPAVRAAKAAAPRTKTLDTEAAALWKLLSSRELATIEQGLSLATALETTTDELLEGVSVDASTGELLRGKRFSGTGPAQPFLDLALYGLMSNAAPGSHAAGLRSGVKKIDLTVAALPRLSGFDALLELRLALVPGFSAPDLRDFAPLPALRTLCIMATPGAYRSTQASLASLAGLQAPALEHLVLRDVGLSDVQTLSQCGHLRSVDLSGNAALDRIEGLASSAALLQELLLEGCQSLSALAPLAGAKCLRRILLKGTGIESLEALADCKAIDELSLQDCSALTSLAGLNCKPLVGPEGERFTLSGCDALQSLAGLPAFGPGITTLDLSWLASLTDLTGIESATGITCLEASHIGVGDLRHLQALQQLEEIDLSGCEQLRDASALGSLRQLKSVRLADCALLDTLPPTWASDLEKLVLTSCPELLSLGLLPSRLQQLSHWDASRIDLRGCNKLRDLATLATTRAGRSATQVDLSDCLGLTSLAGLEALTALERITLPASITDVRAIAHHEGLQVSVQAESTADCTALGVLTAAKSIDLRGCPGLTDLNWVIGLAALEELTVHADSPAAQKSGITRLETAAKVRKLQQAICKDKQLPLPAHLAPLARPVAAVPRKPGALSVKDVKPGLTSAQFSEVRQALARLFSQGDALLYDEIAEGVQSQSAFSGDSEDMGKLFKATKVGQRPLARWALASVLAAAPEAAVVARSVRARIRTVELDFTGLDADAAVPALTGFTALEKVCFKGFPATSLASLSGLGTVRELRLSGAPALATLSGIESASRLHTLELSDCPLLTDLSALAGKPALGQNQQISLDSVAPIRNLEFIRDLNAVDALTLLLDPLADLGPLAAKPAITNLTIHCQGPLPDLGPLVHVQQLECSCRSDWSDDAAAQAAPPHRVWNCSLPALSQLTVHGGTHDFSGLDAPALKSFNAWYDASLADLRGLGGATELSFYSTEIRSLEGLQRSALTELDLGHLTGQLTDISALQAMQALRTLTLPATPGVLADPARSGLQGLARIEKLTAEGLSGSLSFLTGWSELRALDLQKSGALTDLEVLLQLPKLEIVRLRGAQLKREAWPEALRPKLQYR